MYKQIFYDSTRDTKADQSLEISLLDDVLVKTAAEQPAYIKEWADSVQKEPGYTYIMVSAVGSGEVYGSNKNGDYFPEQALLSQQEADEVKPPAVAPKIRYKKIYKTIKGKNDCKDIKNNLDNIDTNFINSL